MNKFEKNITKKDINNKLIEEFNSFYNTSGDKFKKYNESFIKGKISMIKFESNEKAQWENIKEKWKEALNNYFFYLDNHHNTKEIKNWIVKDFFQIGGPNSQWEPYFYIDKHNPEKYDDILNEKYYFILLEIKYCLSIMNNLELEESKTKIFTELNEWTKSNLFLTMFTLYLNIKYIKNITNQLETIETKFHLSQKDYLKKTCELVFNHQNIKENNIIIGVEGEELNKKIKWDKEPDEIYEKYKYFLEYTRVRRNITTHTATHSQETYTLNKINYSFFNNTNRYIDLFYLQLIINFLYILNEIK